MSTFGKRRVVPRRDWSTLSAAPRPASERITIPRTEDEAQAGVAAEIIQAADYPQMMKPADATAFAASIKSAAVNEKGNEIIAGQQGNLRDSVLDHVARLEAAQADGDTSALYEEAHEIRGLADTVGLKAAGRIANGLCQYLDAVSHNDLAPDATAISLHVEAIARAARADDDTLGNVVAEELAALVARKLGEAGAH